MSDNSDKAIAGGAVVFTGLGLVALGVWVIPGVLGPATAGVGALLLMTGVEAMADAGTPDAPFWPPRKTPRAPIPPILGYATPAPPPEVKPEPSYGRRRSLIDELGRKSPGDETRQPKADPANDAQNGATSCASGEQRGAEPAQETAELSFLNWFAATVEHTGMRTDEIQVVGLVEMYIAYCTSNKKQAMRVDALLENITKLATKMGCVISNTGIIGARLRN